MENLNDLQENMTAEDYVKFLHISISYIENKKERTKAIKHLCEVKDELTRLERCFDLPAYEPERSL